MAVDSTSSSKSSTAATGSTAAAAGTTKSAADTRDQFMKMLLAQLKNQDPTNPMDNAQMTSQLAQISTVQGIEQLNATMTKFTAAYGGKTRATDSVGLIGQNVLSAGTTVTLGENATSGIPAGVSMPSAVDALKVELVDAAGNVVDARDFGKRDAGTVTFQWDGKDANDKALPAGTYTMRVTASADGKPVTVSTLTTAQVLGVTDDGSGGTQVLLAGGTSIGTDEIKGVFRP